MPVDLTRPVRATLGNRMVRLTGAVASRAGVSSRAVAAQVAVAVFLEEEWHPHAGMVGDNIHVHHSIHDRAHLVIPARCARRDPSGIHVLVVGEYNIVGWMIASDAVVMSWYKKEGYWVPQLQLTPFDYGSLGLHIDNVAISEKGEEWLNEHGIPY